MGAVLQKLGFGGDEGGGDAAGLSSPMYQLANLMGQVRSPCQDKLKLQIELLYQIPNQDHKTIYKVFLE